MSNEVSHNPHDKFFKEAFSRHDMAVGFFQDYLPVELANRLDWETLRLDSGKFTNEVLRGSESDLLFTVQIDQHPALLYCLFEHQSSPDPWMPLRLLRYILGIWEQYRKQNPVATMLPAILPLVLYQGGDAWTTDTSLSSLIDIPEDVEAYQPDFRHLLVDLNQIPTDALQGSTSLRTILFALKNSRNRKQHESHILISLLAEILEIDPALIRSVMLYLYSVDNETDITEYIKQAEVQNQPKLQEAFMTIADKLRKEGMQQGMHQALQEDILEALELRFQSVSYSLKKQLEDVSDTVALRRLFRLAVQANSLAEFEKGLSG
jgi:predicted transposase/invertase (TIGR01784 family)